MATITNNFNPKKDQDLEENKPQQFGTQSSAISPVAPQQQAPGSGRFTNISRYMAANKQAGTQLGQALGQNVQQAVTKDSGAAAQSQQKLQSQIADAAKQTNIIKDHTTNLAARSAANLPAVGLQSTVVGDKHLASGYQANLGPGAEYAKSIAADQAKLTDFLKYQSGDIASQQKTALDSSKDTAQITTDQAQKTFQQKQDQLQRDRGQLLTDLVKRPGYTGGQRSLDNAFLQMDKGDTLRNVRQNIIKQQEEFNKSNLFPQLTQNYTTTKSNIDDATKSLQAQTQKNIADLTSDVQSRQQSINDARAERVKWLEDQYGKLQRGEKVDSSFVDQAGLKQGQSVFNVLRDVPGVGSMLDVSGLQALASSQADLTNQGDVDLMSSFAKLAATDPTLTQISTLGDVSGQTKGFSDALNMAQQQFDKLSGSHLYGGRDSVGVEIDASRLAELAKQKGITNSQLQNMIDLNTRDYYAGDIPKYLDRHGFRDSNLQNISEQAKYTGAVNQYNKLDKAGLYLTALTKLLKNMQNLGYFNQVNLEDSPVPEKQVGPVSPNNLGITKG